MRTAELLRRSYWLQTPTLREVLLAGGAIVAAIAYLLWITALGHRLPVILPLVMLASLLLASTPFALQVRDRRLEKQRQLQALALQREQEARARDLEWKLSLPVRIIQAIQDFQPSQAYPAELGYHAELQGWLKREFSSARAEVQTGSSRPDICIDRIAVEVKGPSYDIGLKSLADKCIRYLQYYDGLVVVLFDPRYTKQLYSEVVTGIERTFPGKVWFIEKQPPVSG